MSPRDFVAERMPVRVFRDDRALATAAAAAAAAAVVDAQKTRGTANVMLATGNSQIRVLAALVTHHEIDWSAVSAFHMDEYVGIGIDHPASFARYMRDRVVDVVHPGAFHLLRGDAADPYEEAARYAALLDRFPLDLCMLGIGENGHLAFNDPPVADFDDPLAVKVVALDEACKMQQVGEGHFATVDAVPPLAVTATIPTLLGAGAVLAVAPETRKAGPVRDALEGPLGTVCPASILRTRTNTRLFLDHASAAALRHS